MTITKLYRPRTTLLLTRRSSNRLATRLWRKLVRYGIEGLHRMGQRSVLIKKSLDNFKSVAMTSNQLRLDHDLHQAGFAFIQPLKP